MTKLIPFNQFAKKNKTPLLSYISVLVDDKGIPTGFIFGRDSFISFLEYIDRQFKIEIKDEKKAFNNPAGKLIDLIEENLPLDSEFEKTLKKSKKEKPSI